MDGPLPSNLVAEWEGLFDAGLDHEYLEPCERIFAHGVLFPLQRKRELRKMLRMAESAKRVLEIGADKGGGAWHWAFALPEVEKVIAIEVRGTPYAGLFDSWMMCGKFHGIPESSYDPGTVDKVKAILEGGELDVLFLDGDKARYDTDFELYAPLVRTGGLIFFHDVQDNIPPRHAFESASIGREASIILDTTEADEALARKHADIPPRTAHEGWLYHWGSSSCGVGVIVKEAKREG